MNALTIALIAMLGLLPGLAVAGEALKAPKPPKVAEATKNVVLGVGNAQLSKPCAAGATTGGKTSAALCDEIARQMTASLTNQTAPNAKNLGAIVKLAAVDNARDTLSKPCAVGAMSTGKASSAICNEVAGQLTASLIDQTAPDARKVGAIAKEAAVIVAGDTLSKPCVAGRTTSGKAGSAACKEVANQLTASLAGQTAPNAKNIRAGAQAAASNALAASAGQKLSQMLPGSQQPLVGDLLTLGLKRQLPVGADAIGTFAPPINSALPMGTQDLRAGLSIISNEKGKAGLGLKSDIEVGSKKFEISGSLDPNSDSDQGKSAGVQIKIGGN